MSLDKWLDPNKRKEDEKEAVVKKKKTNEKKSPSKSLKKGKEHPEKESKKLTKFILVCSKVKCKYQKIIVKNRLIEKDKICPRCKGIMKTKSQ